MRPAALFTLALLVACTTDPVVAPRDCTPGQTSACVCPGAAGVQTCTDAGTLGACVCPDAGTDATSSDAPTLDAPTADRPDVPSAPDVVDAGPGTDVLDAAAPPSDVLAGGDAACRTAEQPILRRCATDSDCNACAPFVSGLTWCCLGTGYCENTRACESDAGRYVPDVQSTCEGVVRCRTNEDCARTCAPRTNRVWCCSTGGECTAPEAVSCPR